MRRINVNPSGRYRMKRLLLAGAALAATSPAAHAEDIKIGVLLGFTGPIETLAPPIAESAEMALAEANDAGGILGGQTLEPVRGDSTCGDTAAATAAAERLVTSDGVMAIMGAACSGASGAVLANVAVPNGIVMISPASTSPGLSTAEDNDLFFRTAPSDARQGQVLADILDDRGVGEVAVTYTNNDYGKGLSDSFVAAFEGAGGSVTINAPHDDGKGDYSAEVGALASAGGDVLAVFGYADQGGKGVIQAALDAGAFETFLLADGMVADSLLADVGSDLNGSYGANPFSEGEGADRFEEIASDAGIDPSQPFTREAYDAAALIVMGMEAAGGADGLSEAILQVANAPGEEILPGEIGRALEIIRGGGDVDYVGGSNVELIGPGEASGTYREFQVDNGAFDTVKFR